MKKLNIFFFILMFCHLAVAQVPIKGRIIDEDGLPVVGVNIVEKGTNNGTISNVNGEYAISVGSSESILVFSFIGMATVERTINGQFEIDVTMHLEDIGLKEVVLVGYGTQKKSDVTGAVTTIDLQKLETNNDVNFIRSFQGLTPGLTITQNSSGAEESDISLLVRGKNSIMADNSPLVILDGIIFTGSLNEINPNDISSVEILRDASSAAIYGSRGSNGVILISTKKGKIGRPQVSYSTSYSFDGYSNYVKPMTGDQFYEFKVEREGGVSFLTDSEVENYQAGKFTDWIELATRTGHHHNQNLSIMGGTRNLLYYLSGSYTKVNGISKFDDFTRYTLRMNIEQNFNDWLKIGTNTQYTNYDRSGGHVDFSSAFFANPLSQAYDEDGDLTIYPWPEKAGQSVARNILEEAYKLIKDDVQERILTNNYLIISVPFIKGLSYELNTGYQMNSHEIGSYWGRDSFVGIQDNGSASTMDQNDHSLLIENIAQYQNEIGKHSLFITGLYSYEKQVQSVVNASDKQFLNDVRTYYQIGEGEQLILSKTYESQQLTSIMGRVNYAYDSRYLFTATLRRDGFSGFAKNNKYGVFPSIAFGWNLHNEEFFQNIQQIFNNLKLRISYGENGNQAVGPYQALQEMELVWWLDDPTGLTPTAGFKPEKLGNPDLGWEKTRQYNLGLDFGILQSRISGSIDYYNTNTVDLLLDRIISPVHGFTNIVQNIGETKNNGIELNIDSYNISRNNFGWNTKLVFNLNRNEILKLYGDINKDGAVDFEDSDIANKWFIGYPIDVNYEYVIDGVFQEDDDIANSAQPSAQPGDIKLQDTDQDGKITAEDRDFIGKLEPDFYAGVENTFTYKNLSLSFSFYTIQGVTRLNPLLYTEITWDASLRNTIYREFWTPENPINTYPRNAYGTNPLQVNFYEDASFVRFKDITLSYTLPHTLIDKLHIGSLNIYGTVTNPYTVTKWEGMDPELIDQRAIPLTRSFMFGLNASF